MKSIYRCNILEDELEAVPMSAQNGSGSGDRTFSTNLRVLDDDIVELQQQAEMRRQAEGVIINVGPFQVVTLKISL